MEERGGILGGGEPDEYAQAGNFGEAFCNERPADGGCAGIDGLVNQGRRKPEVGEISEGKIPRVRTSKVERWDTGCVVGLQKGMT